VVRACPVWRRCRVGVVRGPPLVSPWRGRGGAGSPRGAVGRVPACVDLRAPSFVTLNLKKSGRKLDWPLPSTGTQRDAIRQREKVLHIAPFHPPAARARSSRPYRVDTYFTLVRSTVLSHIVLICGTREAVNGNTTTRRRAPAGGSIIWYKDYIRKNKTKRYIYTHARVTARPSRHAYSRGAAHPTRPHAPAAAPPARGDLPSGRP
jgi:hypothetical protein